MSMSVLKDLKENKNYQLNFIDLLESICVIKKTKYVELYLRLFMENFIRETDHTYVEDRIKEMTKSEINGEEVSMELSKFNNFQRKLIYHFIEYTGHNFRIEEFNQFCELNERKLISKNDLTTYKSFDELGNEIGLAELKKTEKELENEVHIIYQDDEWVILRPLSHKSANKYGSGTKWCTSSKNNPSTFYDYAHNGILIYAINKKTGLKIGIHLGLGSNYRNLTFWGANSNHIDSMFCGLPSEHLLIVKDHIEEHRVPNFEYCTEEVQGLYQKYVTESKLQSGEVTEVPHSSGTFAGESVESESYSEPSRGGEMGAPNEDCGLRTESGN